MPELNLGDSSDLPERIETIREAFDGYHNLPVHEMRQMNELRVEWLTAARAIIRIGEPFCFDTDLRDVILGIVEYPTRIGDYSFAVAEQLRQLVAS